MGGHNGAGAKDDGRNLSTIDKKLHIRTISCSGNGRLFSAHGFDTIQHRPCNRHIRSTNSASFSVAFADILSSMSNH